MKSKITIPLLALLALGLAGCQDNLENVADIIYDSGAQIPSTVLVDGQSDSQTVSFEVSLPNAAAVKESVIYVADFSLVEVYNALYNEQAVALPQSNFQLKSATAEFLPGSVVSSPVEVTVTSLTDLDRNTVYVLPLTASGATLPVLESQKTRYIVVRGAALINVVANMFENNASLVAPSDATGLSGLNQVTVQWIQRIDEFVGQDSNIQTVLGIEGQFLLRISDSGLPANQLQFVTPSGNVTDASWQFTAGVWQCLTFTYNSDNGEATLYIDGVKKNTCTSGSRDAINWATDNFYVGKSWNDNRYLNGCLSEVRIWNTLLSDGVIAEPDQAYIVPVDSEGLAAYWKFNEGSGSLIHDYANGYDLLCVTSPKWVTVALPEN